MPSNPLAFGTPAAPIMPPAPGENVFSWAMANPDAIRRLIDFHNQMSNLEIAVVQNGVTTRAPLLRPTGGVNALIELQLPSS